VVLKHVAFNNDKCFTGKEAEQWLVFLVEKKKHGYSMEGWLHDTTLSMDWYVHKNLSRLQPYYPSLVGASEFGSNAWSSTALEHS